MTARNGSKRKCAVCGSRYKPLRSDARYCSGACRQAAHRARSKEDELVWEIEAARLRYWRLVWELAAARGAGKDGVVTGEAQFVDEDGNVYMHGEFVGRTCAPQSGWSTWGLEAAGPPHRPPPGSAA